MARASSNHQCHYQLSVAYTTPIPFPEIQFLNCNRCIGNHLTGVSDGPIPRILRRNYVRNLL